MVGSSASRHGCAASVTKRSRAVAFVGLCVALLVVEVSVAHEDPCTSPWLRSQVRARLGVRDFRLARLDLEHASPTGPFAVSVDLGVGRAPIQLAPHSILAPSYQLLVQGADGSVNPAHAKAPPTLRGTVPSLPGARVAGALLEDGLHLLVLHADGRRTVIEPLPPELAEAANADHIVFSGDAIEPSGGVCGGSEFPIIDPGHEDHAHGDSGRVNGLCTAVLACDADVQFFNAYGSVTAVQNRIALLVNAVNLQYETQVGITHQLGTILVRTAEPDPYSSSNSTTLLCQFINEWTNNQTAIDRDMAMLFTGRAIQSNVVGQAADIGSVCEPNGCCSCGIYGTDGSYCFTWTDCCGTFACATDLVAHELGHLWGAYHCNCPNATMNPTLTCTNAFSQSSIYDILVYRNTRTCLDCAYGEGPPNDDCNNAEPVGDGVVLFNNIDATTDGPEEPSDCAGFGDTNIASDIWYSYAAPCSGVLTVDLCGSNYDTKLGVYGSCPDGPGEILACNDDFDCDGNGDPYNDGYVSRVTLTVVGGEVYLLRIGGYNGAQGDGTMMLMCDAIVPPNDDCADALPVSEGTYTIDNRGSTTDGPAEPLCDSYGDDHVGSDVWYVYTPTCAGEATIRLCGSAFDTKLAVYAGSCPTQSAAIACNDDACAHASEVEFPVVAGQTYLLRLGGYRGAQGSGTMLIECEAVPAQAGDLDGDRCVNLADLGLLFGCWGTPCGDVNGDGDSDLADLGIMFGYWGMGCR